VSAAAHNDVVSPVVALVVSLFNRRCLLLALAFAFSAVALAQTPSPELPRIYIDTHWAPPASGRIWHAHTADEFQNALRDSAPGDTIVLDAGGSYQGSFTAPAKSNPEHKWIYVQGSELSTLPAPGKRVDPVRDAAKMPKIVATSSSPAVSVLSGASNYRFVGLEFYSTSNMGCDLGHTPRVNCFTYFLLDMPADQGKSLPDSITVDRCYLHGSDTQDVRAAVVANGTNVAVIDSYISDIHQSTSDSQAIRVYRTPGPIKVINNFLSSTTENLMFGGAGGADNPYIASDLEVRNNHFYKPERWAAPGITLPPAPQWSVKNSLEFKSARRALVSGNIFENNWFGAQWGFAIVLTVRTSDSGNIAVVDDITIENNLLTNVASGFNSLAHDDQCKLPRWPFCNSPGEARHWKIVNNLIQLRSASAPGGSRPQLFSVAQGLADVLFQHNTVVPAAGTSCFESVYFRVDGGQRWPLAEPGTRNVWITDNLLCRPPTGDYGGQGIAGLLNYMGDSPPLEKRFAGNVIFVPKDAQPASFPGSNRLTPVGIHFANAAAGDYELVLPKWTKTTDGKPTGVDMKSLNAAIAGVAGPDANH
jgi:hypothetical protein